MRYFDIPTIQNAIERLQNYSANWLLPAFVFAANDVGTDMLVDMSAKRNLQMIEGGSGMTNKCINDFHHGVFYSASLLIEHFDAPRYAADVLQEAGLLGADVSSLDETEQFAMRKLMEHDSRARFTGFTV